MEENIHIHYRDLRIELSRGEFEDICDAFRKQSQELQTIINEKNYQDGKLPMPTRMMCASGLNRCSGTMSNTIRSDFRWRNVRMDFIFTAATTSFCSMRLNSAR